MVYENSQARERTQILMDIANQTWGMVIGTGDLSELALGWATYNGDHMSMYGVNGSVPKTLVKYLVKWVAENDMDEASRMTLLDIVDTPISPELIPADENGNITAGEILLPPGKTPFVLSQDDVCYYHYMDGDGFATKLVVDEEGKIRNEYVEDDGSVSVGDYDMVPLIDRFVEQHPDFSYRGAKGIVALTGYNGILGYRTDESYETRPADLDENKVQWLDAHPDFSLEKEREGAKKVADAMKAEGWEFASHTWGHQNVGQISLEKLQEDTEKFKKNVDPLIGGTDIIIFAFGTDITTEPEYSGDKFEYLKGQGYNYFCNVDSSQYYVQIRDRYFRQGRRNLDGYRMYYNPELLEDLFNAKDVFDPARPTPVPPMG